MRIASWNINSVNRRVDLVRGWLSASATDVLCIQETKCKAEAFPDFSDLGYETAVIGDGAWNGVAILSRVGLSDVAEQLTDAPQWEDTTEPRAIGATCADLRVWSLYVPNGRTLDHPHFDYKLRWMQTLSQTAETELKAHPNLLLIGDFNITPTDADVYDISAFEGSTHVTEEERAELRRLESVGLTEIEPRPLKYDRAYTFWDYRQLAFPKNRGMRIDLAYGSDPVRAAVTDAYSDRNARKGKGTSDHAPVVIDLDWPHG